MTLQEGLGVLTNISSKTCETIKTFENLFIDHGDTHLSCIKSLKKAKSIYNGINRISEDLNQQVVDYIEKEDCRNTDDLAFKNKLCTQLDQHKSKVTELLDALNEVEKQLIKAKEKLIACKESGRTLDNLKNEAKLMKQITSTSFSYQDEKVCGYTVGRRHVKPFLFDSNKMTQKAITEALWNHLKLTFAEDYEKIRARLKDNGDFKASISNEDKQDS